MLQPCQQIRVIPAYSARIVLPFVSIVSSFSPFHQAQKHQFSIHLIDDCLRLLAYQPTHAHFKWHLLWCSSLNLDLACLNSFCVQYSEMSTLTNDALTSIEIVWRSALYTAIRKLCAGDSSGFFFISLSLQKFCVVVYLELLVNFWALAQDRTTNRLLKNELKKWRNEKRISVCGDFFMR